MSGDRQRNKRRRGATSVEMALTGIPIIFILICVFEISRGMWMYHTAAYAVKNGVRYSIVHGVNCYTAPNACPTVSISSVATRIQDSAVGLDRGTTQLTFTPGATGAAAYTCYLAAPGSPLCSSQTTQWPPDTLNGVGKSVRIDIKTPFLSALGLYWPGSGIVAFRPMNFGASSLDYIQF